MSGKVFCVGFQKTGTTTMMHALTELGYRVTGPNHVRDKDIARKLGRITTELSHRYDAFQDNPWPLVYREMDALHPGSKFILTLRDEQKWYDSFSNHFDGRDRTPMAELIYGTHPEGDAEYYKARLRRHNDEVRAYFRDRPDDLLVIDVARDSRWEPLCAFLGKPVPAKPFPHSNHRGFDFLPPTLRGWLKKGWRKLGRSTGLRTSN
ncbi:MAG TPA: sulfotransferase [Amaricoccus sp.]|jgi:hypothetical protein|nr:sulfotransferase [Amaricoccus sp.]